MPHAINFQFISCRINPKGKLKKEAATGKIQIDAH
jgi:hypothetical protein